MYQAQPRLKPVCVCLLGCVRPPEGANRSYNRWEATGADLKTRLLIISHHPICLFSAVSKQN